MPWNKLELPATKSFLEAAIAIRRAVRVSGPTKGQFDEQDYRVHTLAYSMLPGKHELAHWGDSFRGDRVYAAILYNALTRKKWVLASQNLGDLVDEVTKLTADGYELRRKSWE